MADAPELPPAAVLLLALDVPPLAAGLPALLQAASPAARARPAVATDAVPAAVRQPRVPVVLVLGEEFSCIVVPSTSLSTVRRCR
jgi:hypothetical protein